MDSQRKNPIEGRDREDLKSQGEESKSLLYSNKGLEILNMLKKGTEFTHELLKENEKLRYHVAKLEEQNGSIQKNQQNAVSRADFDNLARKFKSLEEEKSKLVEKFSEVEKENMDFATKYVEIEQENSMLANLYVASYQLHSSLDLNEVLRIIVEIIINLIGAEVFALMLLDEKTHLLKAVAAEGMDPEQIPSIKAGDGLIGRVVREGEHYCKDDLSLCGEPDPLAPIVCIPMKIRERVIGAIAIYSFLQQKKCLTNIDSELFSMLAGHAATAVFSSKLYTESERRLSTIQGFMDLITK